MKLPPLNALKAFEVAARQQSFLLAAQELHVSAASISRFIKVIESNLNQTLFNRHPNGVELTELGEQYFQAIQPALQSISSISDDFRQQSVKRRLKIITIPAIAETWLVSRLWRFQQIHKDIQINLELDDQPVSLRKSEATVWLNYSDGTYKKTNAYTMPDDCLTLVCNQEIAQSLNTPEDIFKFPFLVDIDWIKDWKTWMHAAQIQPDIPTNHINFERYSMVINAAIAGSGVAIGHTAIVEDFLKMGTLIAPFNITAKAEKQFYAVTAKNCQRKSVQQFIDWFLHE